MDKYTKICIICNSHYVARSVSKYCSNKCRKQGWKNKLGMDEYRKRRRNEPSYGNVKPVRNYNIRIRQKLLDLYGHKCACCGISNDKFLTLQHKNLDGNIHRARNNNNAVKVWRDAIDDNDHNKYEILCWNCNCATKDGAICPHKEIL